MNDIPSILKAMQEEQEAKLREAGLSPLESGDNSPQAAAYRYEMALKRKSPGGVLAQAMREAGYEDLMKMVKFKKVREKTP